MRRQDMYELRKALLGHPSKKVWRAIPQQFSGHHWGVLVTLSHETRLSPRKIKTKPELAALIKELDAK